MSSIILQAFPSISPPLLQPLIFSHSPSPCHACCWPSVQLSEGPVSTAPKGGGLQCVCVCVSVCVCVCVPVHNVCAFLNCIHHEVSE